MKVGVQINFKNGNKDWIDPCEYEEVLSQIEKDILVFNNSHANYEYNRKDIKQIIVYQLCDICGHDLRDEKNKCCLNTVFVNDVFNF